MIKTTTEILKGRPYFELAIDKASMVIGCARSALREKIKYYMKKRGEIVRSTTELSDKRLHEYGQKLMDFYGIFVL